MNLINIAIAQETAQEIANTAAKQPSMLTSMMPLVLIMVVFYFLLIRPQQKKMREHQDLIKSISKGDEVITAGGIMGKVFKIEEDKNLVHLEIADNVKIRIRREMITEVIRPINEVQVKTA